MTEAVQGIYDLIQADIQNLPLNEFLVSPEEEQNLRNQKVEQIIRLHSSNQDLAVKNRLDQEFTSWGPLTALLNDEDITEILVNNESTIWFEKGGKLHKHPDHFLSTLSFGNILDRICHESNTHITKERPCADGQFKSFRFSLIGADLTLSAPQFTLRRHPKNPWTLFRLEKQGWCNSQQSQILQTIMIQRQNFMVVGGTGSGKTSVLNSLLNLTAPNERNLIIEDTPELSLPNEASLRLVTRDDPQGILPSIDQTQLVKRSLRLRPDRIIMGEIRGPEAKDFLQALATGHSGSFGTLHAQDAHQALIRLEMLIQMGAPQWSLHAIRRLIHMSLQYIIVTGKCLDGSRKLQGIFRICSLEENGFLVESVD